MTRFIEASKIRQRMFDDERQTQFTKNGSLNSNDVIDTLNEICMCPFCLFRKEYKEFIVTERNNVFECPECHNTMLRSTLLKEITIEEFAKWVYDYAKNGFWHKCKFETFNRRLYEMGLSKRFWDVYKLLKGTREESEID